MAADNPQSKTYNLVVIGGGITGLSAAHLAAKQGKSVALLEKSFNFGGLLASLQVGGTPIEQYYHHFFTHDKELLWLLNQLNLDDKIVFRKTTMGVYSSGQFFGFNKVSDLLFFKPIKFFDKLRFIVTTLYLTLFANWEHYENKPAIEWLKKLAGKSTVQYLWAPLLNVKFGNQADKVPLSWLIGRLVQRFKSRKKGAEQLGYLDGGFIQIVQAITAELDKMGVELINNCSVTQVEIKGGSVRSVESNKGSFVADQFLFCIPGFQLQSILSEELFHKMVSPFTVSYFGVICVFIELKKALSDYYWLNIADDRFFFGGVIEHTNFIPSKTYGDTHIVYLSRYFTHDESIGSKTDDEIAKMVWEQLPKLYSKFTNDNVKKIRVYRSDTAAPICGLNFSERVPHCKTEIGNLYIANMEHVYPDERSTNNAVRVALNALDTMGIFKETTIKTNSLSGKIGFK